LIFLKREREREKGLRKGGEGREEGVAKKSWVWQ
jgi:hypothetical protein